MFKLSKKDQDCLLKIGIGTIIIVVLLKLYRRPRSIFKNFNLFGSSSQMRLYIPGTIVEGQEPVPEVKGPHRDRDLDWMWSRTADKPDTDVHSALESNNPPCEQEPCPEVKGPHRDRDMDWVWSRTADTSDTVITNAALLRALYNNGADLQGKRRGKRSFNNLLSEFEDGTPCNYLKRNVSPLYGNLDSKSVNYWLHNGWGLLEGSKSSLLPCHSMIFSYIRPFHIKANIDSESYLYSKYIDGEAGGVDAVWGGVDTNSVPARLYLKDHKYIMLYRDDGAHLYLGVAGLLHSGQLKAVFSKTPQALQITYNGYIRALINKKIYMLSWSQDREAIWTPENDDKNKLQFISVPGPSENPASEIKNFQLVININNTPYYLQRTSGYENKNYITNNAGERAPYGAWQKNVAEPLQYIPDGGEGYIKQGQYYLTFVVDKYSKDAVHLSRHRAGPRHPRDETIWAAWMRIPGMFARIKITGNRVTTKINEKTYYLSQFPGVDPNVPWYKGTNRFRMLNEGRKWGVWSPTPSDVKISGRATVLYGGEDSDGGVAAGRDRPLICDTGYTINSDKTKCEKNTCKCDNGTPTLGRQCPTNGASLCAECKIGYHLTDSNTKCIEARRLPFILKAESSHWGNEGPKYLSWSGGQRSLPNGKKYAIWDPRKSGALRLKLTSEGVLYTAEEIGGHVRYLNMYFDAADGHRGWVRVGSYKQWPSDGLLALEDGPLIFPVWDSHNKEQVIHYKNKGGITTFTGGKMKFTKNNKTYDIESVYPYMYYDEEGNSLGTYDRLSNNRDYGELTTKGSRLTITKVIP